MKKLNTHITDAWSGVKQPTNITNIKAWCEDMGIKNYIINSQGEIDVDGDVSFIRRNFEVLPYKFGTVTGYFSLTSNKNLTSLKNCPDNVGRWFACNNCIKLDSLEGCPKKVGSNFWCNGCKCEFTEGEVKSLCKVKGKINT